MVSTSLLSGQEEVNRKEGNPVRTEPYYCICLRPACNHEWETRDQGEGHEEPRRCANYKCRSPYWDDPPKIWLTPEFDPESIRKPDGTKSERLIKRCIIERKKRGLLVSV
jgi:hypothetical protein